MEKEHKLAFMDIVQKGLSRVAEEHAYLVKTFTEMLRNRGEHEAADLVDNLKHVDDVGNLRTSQVQAISFYFQLLNIAEEHVANVVCKERETRIGFGSEPGHWGYYLKILRERGFSEQELRKQLPEIKVEPVFTKHPTESKRWPVLGLHREIVRILRSRDTVVTSFDQEQFESQLAAVLERLWLTGEIFLEKPEVEDELENLSYYLKEIFPVVLNRLDDRLKHAWKQSWPEAEALKDNELPQLQFGSWVGGDRDGHPKVIATVTRDTLLQMRRGAIGVIRQRLSDLERQLSFNATQIQPPGKLLAALDVDPETGKSRNPWESFVRKIYDNLESSRCMEIRQQLENLHEWLLNSGATSTAGYYVRPLIRMLDTFGLHLARLDVRQNSDFYAKALSQMMEAAGINDACNYPDWPEERKLEFLNSELSHPRPLTHASMDLPAEAREVRATFAELASYRDQFGLSGLGSLIISMTRNLSDLLAVYVLTKEVGLTHMVGGDLRCDLPVVPLFETFDDLERAPSITDAFLSHPCTRQSVKGMADGHQGMIIMLGYSDSNKDAGIIASQWALQRAQRRLLETGEKHGLDIMFFHGRGGTIGRGAGPTHRFLEALPQGSLSGGLRITEQGEVIGQKFNTPTTAAANLESLIAGSFGSRLLSSSSSTDEKISEALEFLSKYSKKEYRSLLETDGFMSFYRQATPIDAIEQSRIGSRPSRRTGQASLKDLRAIPWVFSWNQARFYLPGWFGVGSALEALHSSEPDLFKDLQDQLQGSAFLRYLFYNIESSHASSDPEWMKHYADLVVEKQIRDQLLGIILAEHERTSAFVSLLTGGRLEDRRPRFWSTLKAREAPLKLLHAKQIQLLQEFRSSASDKASLLEQLLVVVNAIASGLRTTG